MTAGVLTHINFGDSIYEIVIILNTCDFGFTVVNIICPDDDVTRKYFSSDDTFVNKYICQFLNKSLLATAFWRVETTSFPYKSSHDKLSNDSWQPVSYSEISQ